MSYELTKKLKNVDTNIPREKYCAIRLNANESCFDISQRLGSEFASVFDKVEYNRYPDPLARGVTEAFAEFYGVDPDLCTAGNGSDELIALILGAFFEKGDSILTLSPDFSMYAFYGFLNELKIKTMPKEDTLKINIPKVIDFCNNNDIKAVIFSNPCNPTSLGLSRQDIIKLVKNVFCLVIVDEAYMDFWGESVLDIVNDYDNVIILKTCSKNMGLAAVRLGFAVSCKTITTAMKAVKSPFNISALDQAAASVVLKNKPVIMECTAEIVRQRNILQTAMDELAEKYPIIERVYQSVTNFIFFKSSKSGEIRARLEERSIAVRELGDYIRVTVGTEKENGIFISALTGILPAIDQ